jgi:hypothetical protein
VPVCSQIETLFRVKIIHLEKVLNSGKIKEKQKKKPLFLLKEIEYATELIQF